jgi:hypothetical protein
MDSRMCACHGRRRPPAKPTSFCPISRLSPRGSVDQVAPRKNRRLEFPALACTPNGICERMPRGCSLRKSPAWPSASLHDLEKLVTSRKGTDRRQCLAVKGYFWAGIPEDASRPPNHYAEAEVCLANHGGGI